MNIRTYGLNLKLRKRRLSKESTDEREVGLTEDAFSVHVESPDKALLVSVWEDPKTQKLTVTLYSSAVELHSFDGKKFSMVMSINGHK